MKRPKSSIRAVIAPPIYWMSDRKSFLLDMAPDPFKLFETLEASGIQFELIDPGHRPWNPFAGKSSLLQSLDPLRSLKILLGRRSSDLVVSVFEGSAVCILALRRLFGFKGAVVLWDIGLTESWRLRERILDFVVPRADAIMVLGSSQKAYIERRWSPKRPVIVIFHYVDSNFYRPRDAVPEGPILSIGDDVGRDFSGLITAIKGLEAKLVVKTNQSVTVPPDQIANVEVIRNRISYEQLRDMYSDSRFVVVPLHDTLNASGVSTILEAGAMEKALIVSASAAIMEYVVPDETCLVVPCGDHAALRQAIERLLNEPETCARLGANARRFVEERFSISAFATDFAATLKMLAAK